MRQHCGYFNWISANWRSTRDAPIISNGWAKLPAVGTIGQDVPMKQDLHDGKNENKGRKIPQVHIN